MVKTLRPNLHVHRDVAERIEFVSFVRSSIRSKYKLWNYHVSVGMHGIFAQTPTNSAMHRIDYSSVEQFVRDFMRNMWKTYQKPLDTTNGTPNAILCGLGVLMMLVECIFAERIVS